MVVGGSAEGSSVVGARLVTTGSVSDVEGSGLGVEGVASVAAKSDQLVAGSVGRGAGSVSLFVAGSDAASEDLGFVVSSELISVSEGMVSESGLTEQLQVSAVPVSGISSFVERVSAAGSVREVASVVAASDSALSAPEASLASVSEFSSASASVSGGSASILALSVSAPAVSATGFSVVAGSVLGASAAVLEAQFSGSEGSGFAAPAKNGSSVVTGGNDNVNVSVPVRLEGSKQSYLAAVQKKTALSKHDLSIVSDEGGEFVQVPDDILQDVNHLWDDLIIGKFPEDSPHIAKVHVIVNKIWTYGNKQSRIDAFVVNKTTIKFRIKDPVIRARVLRRGMWNIADKPMMVSKYGPVEEEDHSAPLTMSLWVSISQIPPSFFSWKGLSFLSSVVGEPKRLHPDTELCTKFDEAKVFIEVDLTKPLPESYKFKTRQGVTSEVKYSYPWLPPRCCACGKWGHLIDACRTITLLKRGNESPSRQSVVAANLVPLRQACATIINSSGTTHPKPDPPHPVCRDTDVGGGFATPLSGLMTEGEELHRIPQSPAAVNVQEYPALSHPVCKDSDVGDRGGSPLCDSQVVQGGNQVAQQGSPPAGDKEGWSLVSPKNSHHSRKVNSEIPLQVSPSRFSVLAGQEDLDTHTGIDPAAAEPQGIPTGGKKIMVPGPQQLEGKKYDTIIRPSLPRQSKNSKKYNSAASNLNRKGEVMKKNSN